MMSHSASGFRSAWRFDSRTWVPPPVQDAEQDEADVPPLSSFWNFLTTSTTSTKELPSTGVQAMKVSQTPFEPVSQIHSAVLLPCYSVKLLLACT